MSSSSSASEKPAKDAGKRKEGEADDEAHSHHTGSTNQPPAQSSSNEEPSTGSGNSKKDSRSEQPSCSGSNVHQTKTTTITTTNETQAASTTPQSSSSTPSTGSSSNNTANTNTTSSSSSGATPKPMGKFKEKRPEPLDLSIKSATILPPCGGFSNLFNGLGSNPMTTLETPRIVWNDNNDPLLSKYARLYSTGSSSASNVRMKLSSLGADSPPITPGTPYMDQLMMFASSNSIAATSGSPTASLSCRSAGGAIGSSGHFNQFSSSYQQQQQKQLIANQLQQQAPHSAKSFLLSLNGNNSEGSPSSPLQALLTNQRHFNQWQQMIEQQHQVAAAEATAAAALGPATNTNKNNNNNNNNSSSSAFAQFVNTSSPPGSSMILQAAYNNRKFKSTNQGVNINNNRMADTTTTTRRSCSSDDLLTNTNRLSCSGNQSQEKKKSISPLATKNVSFCYNSASNNSNSNQSNSNQESQKQKMSPVINVSGESQSWSNESNMQLVASNLPMLTSGNNSQAPTPASVANATENLLNIHLSSPTSSTASSSMTPMFSGAQANEVSPALPPSLNEFLSSARSSSSSHNVTPTPWTTSSNDQNLDPLLACGYAAAAATGRKTDQIIQKSPFSNHLNCIQQQQQQQQQQQHLNGSLSSSTTLNTPTLISPSQLKAGGSICFLPSPTLSPMSSVFELPSPLLMFPPSSGSQQQQQTPTAKSPSDSVLASLGSRKSEQPDQQLQQQIACSRLSEQNNANRTASEDTLSSQPIIDTNTQQVRQNLSENSLAHLVTSARDKVGALAVAEPEEFKMEVDPATIVDPPLIPKLDPLPARPATTLPKILVSEQDINNNNNTNFLISRGEPMRSCSSAEVDLRHQEENIVEQVSTNKRAISQDRFRVRNSFYHRERSESSSAPPEVCQRRSPNSAYYRPAPKLKGAVSSNAVAASGNQFPSAASTGYNQQHPVPPQTRPYSAQGYLQPHSTPNNNSYHAQPVHQQQLESHQSYHHQKFSPYPAPERSWSATGAPAQAQSPMQALLGYTHSPRAMPFNQSRSQSQQAVATVAAAALAQPILPEATQWCQDPVTSIQQTSYSQNSQTQQPALPLQQAIHQQQQQQPGYCSFLLSNSQQSGANHNQCISQASSLFQASANLTDSKGLGASSRFPSASHHNNNQQQHLVPSAPPQSSQQEQISSSTGELSSVVSQISRQPTRSGYFATNSSQQQRQQANISHLIHQSPNQIVVANQQHQYHGQRFQISGAGFGLKAAHSVDQALNSASLLHQQNNNNTNNNNNNNNSHHHHQSRLGVHASVGADLYWRRPSSACCVSGSSSSPTSSPSSTTTTTTTGASSLLTGAGIAPKRYHCDLCRKAFTRSDMLTRHKRLHSGDRPFQCNECKQEFSRSDHLSTHMRTHTGEKPYKCKLCTYSACRKDMITRHMKVHNRNPSPGASQHQPASAAGAQMLPANEHHHQNYLGAHHMGGSFRKV